MNPVAMADNRVIPLTKSPACQVDGLKLKTRSARQLQCPGGSSTAIIYTTAAALAAIEFSNVIGSKVDAEEC